MLNHPLAFQDNKIKGVQFKAKTGSTVVNHHSNIQPIMVPLGRRISNVNSDGPISCTNGNNNNTLKQGSPHQSVNTQLRAIPGSLTGGVVDEKIIQK